MCLSKTQLLCCETPDTQQAIFEFDGFTLLWDHGIGIDGGYYGRSHGVDLIKGDGKGLQNHMMNFIDGIRTGAPLNCPVDIAAGVARTCHLGNVAFKTGRRLYWDAGSTSFINDTEANAYLHPEYRKPWELPTV